MSEKCSKCNTTVGSLHKTGLCIPCRNTPCLHCGKVNTWQKAQKRNCGGCGKKLDDKFRNYTGHIDFDSSRNGCVDIVPDVR